MPLGNIISRIRLLNERLYSNEPRGWNGATKIKDQSGTQVDDERDTSMLLGTVGGLVHRPAAGIRDQGSKISD